MIARQISFFAPAAVMSAWATVMLHCIISGHINRLLSPLFRNYVLSAAVLLLVLSALHLLLYQPEAKTAPSLAPAGRLRQLGRWLVLLIPVIAAAMISPNALSSTTAMNKGIGSTTTGAIAMPTMSDEEKQKVQDALGANPNAPVPVEVTDLLTLCKSPDQYKAFEGREVRCVGFLIGANTDHPKLLRWMMWCCAADAQPISVDVSGNLAGDWKETQWLEIVGKVEFPSVLGQVVPKITVETVNPTQEPDEPYLSP